MKMPSENIETYPDWLTEEQITVLEHLKDAGSNGINQHKFYMHTNKEVGIDSSEFSQLISKGFIKTASGKNKHDNRYVHTDFVLKYNANNSDHRSIMLNTANALSHFKGATRNPSGFMDNNWEKIKEGLSEEQIIIAEKLRKVPKFRQYVTRIFREISAEG